MQKLKTLFKEWLNNPNVYALVGVYIDKPTTGKEQKMKIAKIDGKPEIFYTIQGEGKTAGKPAIFIRFSLCNLHCTWCDTDYTWNWEGTPFTSDTGEKFKREEQIIEMEVQEVIDYIKQWDCKRIVFTGGEPMIQQRKIATIMKVLKPQGYIFEVETNGTMIPKENFDNLIDQYNVSPKLANSNNERKLREKEDSYKFFVNSLKSQFKYVICQEKDLQEVLELVDRYKIPEQKIWLMPEGKTREEIERKHDWLIEIAKENGFNFTSRLHVLVWGAERGV